MTRDDLIANITADIIAAVPTNITLTPTNMKTPLNSAIGAVSNAAETVDPSKPPTIKHLTDVSYS